MVTEAERRANQSVAKNLREVIGQGIDFPFRFISGAKVGSIEQSNAGERINDSIHLILSTRPGERTFNPEFGSRLPLLVFEPNDATLQNLLRFYTADALKRWEKRIEVLNITFIDDYNDDRNTIGISIEYTIRNSHVAGSYVYPFVREGMPTGDLYTGVEVNRMTQKGTIT
jgi:phage baseplate assembly protein W